MDQVRHALLVATQVPNLVLLMQVYEWMVYTPEYPRMATFPDMFDRCISIGSAGKSYSVTGYKVGWAIGPAWFVEAMFKIHQQLTFSVATPMQEGIARALVSFRFDQIEIHF